MPKYPAGSIEKNGQSYPVEVDDQGRWNTTEHFGGTTLYADTKDALEAQIAKAVRRTAVKVSVPFCVLSGDVFQYGTATGIHSVNGNVLVTWKDGRKEQLKRRWQEVFLVPLDEKQAQQYLSLRRIMRAATETFEEYEREHRIQIANEITRAIETVTQQDS